jgi:hypothetical protein
MEDPEFTHPGLRMIRDSNSLRIILPVKAQRYRRLLHAVWFLVWVAGEAALVASLMGWQPMPAPPRPVLIAFLGAFTAAGGFVLYRLLWYLAGREIFIVTRDRLTLRREIAGIGHTRTFDRRAIRRIQGRRLNYDVVYPSWGRMFIGHGEGEILIEADGETHAYGKGLEVEEARILASLMQQEMSVRQDRRPSEVRAG